MGREAFLQRTGHSGLGREGAVGKLVSVKALTAGQCCQVSVGGKQTQPEGWQRAQDCNHCLGLLFCAVTPSYFLSGSR